MRGGRRQAWRENSGRGPVLPLYSIYRSPHIYRAVMRLLYGPADEARFQAVLACIPRGVAVLELCCGPGGLGARLRARGDRAYLGIERNGPLWRAALGQELEVWRADVLEVALPPADVVVMMSSLYHFGEGADALLEQMRAAARLEVILSEPVVNLAGHRSRWVRAVAAHLSDAGRGPEYARFDEAGLRALLERHEPIGILPIGGGRELLARLPGRAAPSD